MADAKRDGNRATTIIGVSNIDDATTIPARVGATSKAQHVELVDSSGNSVAVGSGTQYTEGDVDATITGTAMMWEDTSNTLRAVSAAKPLPVSATLDTTGLATSAKQDTQDTSINTLLKPASTLAGVTTVGTVSAVTAITNALPAGTNAIGKLAANSGIDIGDVDILSIAAGDNNIGNVDIVSGTVTTVTTLTGGGIAHDSADSGNPHKIGYKAYSPDGTTPGTAVAEGDRTDAKADLDGRQLVNVEHPRWWSYHEDSSNALTDTSVQSAPGAGFQIVVTEIMVSTGAATALNVFFEEGSTKVLGPWYLEAVAGRGLFWKGNKHITANTALTITTSAAIAHSVDIQGYIQAL